MNTRFILLGMVAFTPMSTLYSRSIEDLYWQLIAQEFPELFSNERTYTVRYNAPQNHEQKAEQKLKKETYTFKNLVGKIPQDVLEVRDFIHNAQKFKQMGARIPNGILLVGPPGTGKTSIARAIAGESEAVFFAASGPEFVDKYVGEGARKVRELFEQARDAVQNQGHKKAIIFIDEIDSIAGTRGEQENMYKRDILNELLAQMSGFNQDDSIFVIAATNRVSDIDPALKRPGRFDRIVEINLPDLESRKEILTYYLKKIKSHSSVNVSQLAEDTWCMTPADLENLVNEAAIRAVRDGSAATTMSHFQEALKAIIERNRLG